MAPLQFPLWQRIYYRPHMALSWKCELMLDPDGL